MQVRTHHVLPAVAALLLLTACGQQPSRLASAPSIPPDLAGHQFDRPDADRVLVAGDTTTVTTPTSTLRVTVMGPALEQLPTMVPMRVGERHSYLATFTVTVAVLRGSEQLAPAAFRLLAISDQVDGATKHTTVATATTLVRKTVTSGTWTGTWTAPFLEGHGELLFTPAGATRPAALWDFRAES